MRRSEKKAILEMLDTLDAAHKEYMRFRLSGDSEGCSEVLVSCQECAVAIGNAIEKSQGMNTESVRKLEAYCEDVYQLSIGNYGVKLDEDLQEIRKCIIDEIKVVLEVVFFPYKASMWDSMESIYREFKKRGDAHVYLVPIPYYNRKGDGSVEQFHCEKDLFPSDEEVTDWQKFDLEKIKPDIAFIHNPYDDTNFVTTVDPGFYSYKLKEYVECLIYCPYYSTAGITPKSLGLSKSFFYVDYIVTQSARVSDTYDRSVPGDKFLPMGSPKFDKVIQLCHERISDPDKFYSRVPEEWVNKGTGKRLYFYNTGISGLLGNAKGLLCKMKYVFSIFLKQSDALLIWRPHPLFEDTLKALRDDYYDDYIAIKQLFLNSEFGILDETPDISVTVAYCDSFVGDGGTSVASLFVACGKPVFILDNTIMRDPVEEDIHDYYFQLPYDDILNGYVITLENMVFKCSFNGDDYIKFCYECSVSDYFSRLYNMCWRYGEDIFFAPALTEEVLVYHVSDGSTTRIKLRHCTDQTYVFFAGAVYSKYLVLIPNEYPYFVRVDMETGEAVYSDDCREVYLTEDNNYARSFGGFSLVNNFLYVASRSTNRVLKLNIDTMQYDTIVLGMGDETGYSGISCIQKTSGNELDSLIFLPYRGMNITRLYPDSGKVDVYTISNKNFYCSGQDYEDRRDDIMPFSSVIAKDELLILAPCRGNKFISLNTETGASDEWNFPLSLGWQPLSRYFTGGYKGKFLCSHDKHYWLSGTSRCIYEIDVSKEGCRIVKEIHTEFNVNEIKQHARGFCEYMPGLSLYGLHENPVNSLESFLRSDICGSEFDKQKEFDSIKKYAENLDGSCGRHVCEFLMKKMLC